MNMKQKKQTKKQIKRLEKRELKKKNKEWSNLIKERDNYKCAYSGSVEFIQAAHVIPREILEFRHDIDNGITLRAKFHKMHPKKSEDKSLFSAHYNPFAFFIWFMEIRPEQFNRLKDKWKRYLINKT